MTKFPLNNCNPTPEEYERLKAAAISPNPPMPEYVPPFPDQVDAAVGSEEYEKLRSACTGERKPKKKPLPKNFQMSVDVEIGSAEYEEIRRQSKAQMFPRKD